MRIEVVYSRYDEPVDFAFPVTLYNKGAPLGLAGETCLPNVGLDTHAVLYHLAARYDTLAPVTVFLCGSFRKRPENVWANLTAYGVADAQGFAGARWHPDEGWPGPIRHHSRWAKMLEDGAIRPSPYTLGQWWDRVLGGPRPERMWYVPGQTFGVAAWAVRQRPRRWYRQLRDWFGAGPRYPEECHHMERSWFYVFRRGGRRDVDL